MNHSIPEYEVGDKIQIALEQDDVDQRYDGMVGEILDIGEDDLGGLTGNAEDDYMYTVELENGEIPGIHFRKHDLLLVE